MPELRHRPVMALTSCCEDLLPSEPPFLAQTYLPLDMRVKKTRAIRRRLTKAQVSWACILGGCPDGQTLWH